MYQIIETGCSQGYAFVRDHLGNKCYYGSIKDCQQFIRAMTKEYQRYINSLRRRSENDR